jgi:hypothetical protein
MSGQNEKDFQARLFEYEKQERKYDRIRNVVSISLFCTFIGLALWILSVNLSVLVIDNGVPNYSGPSFILWVISLIPALTSKNYRLHLVIGWMFIGFTALGIIAAATFCTVW